jgi:hypothetical protein
MTETNVVLAKRPSPYSANHFGHARICDCSQCATYRTESVLKAWVANGRAAVPDPAKTIFVRSHFRADPKRRHFRKYPTSKARLIAALKKLAAQHKGGRA